MTEWRAIPGYEGRYDISDDGQVRSWLPWRGSPTPRLLNPALGERGYLYVNLSRSTGVIHPRTIHQLVTLAFIGPQPEGMPVRHLDGNPTNNQRINLIYGTPSENSKDVVRHGHHRGMAVAAQLRTLGLKSREVRAWAIRQGQCQGDVRGWVSQQVLDNYLTAHPQQRGIAQ